MLWMADWDSTTSASFWAAAIVVASAIDFATTAEAAVLSPCAITEDPFINVLPKAQSFVGIANQQIMRGISWELNTMQGMGWRSALVFQLLALSSCASHLCDASPGGS